MKKNYSVTGLTGQSGAGKTAVGRIFAENGFAVIDADMVSREVMKKGEPCLVSVSEAFGEEILTPQGELDRKKLGGIVFSDREKLDLLDKTCYPFIIDRINEYISRLVGEGEKFILLDAPTLFEAGADKLCDCIISVAAEEEIRLERITLRDGISKEAAMKRFSSQYPQEFFISNSDYILENNGSETSLAKKAEELSDKIKEKFSDDR